MPPARKQPPSQAWVNALAMRQQLEVYPYDRADWDDSRIFCMETEFLRCDVAIVLLRELFLMCQRAVGNKTDIRADGTCLRFFESSL